MPTLKIDPRTNKLIIEIDESQEVISQALKRQSPPPSTLGALPAAAPRYIRHKRPIISSGFINIYDFAQYKADLSADFQDRIINYFPTLEEAKNQTPAVLNMVKDAVRPAFNAPLNYPVSEWTRRFKKLTFEDAVKYRFDLAVDSTSPENQQLNSDNDNWTEKGLKFDKLDIVATAYPQDGNNVYYQVGGLFPYFFHSGGCKITKTPHYEGEAVTLKLTPKGGDINIFLNPTFFYMNTVSFSNHSTSNSSPPAGSAAYFVYYFNECSSSTRFPANVVYTSFAGENTEKNLNYFFTTWQRSQIFNNPAPIIPDEELVRRFTEEMKKHEGARAIETINTITSTSLRAFPTFPEGGIPSLATRLCNWGYRSNPVDVGVTNVTTTDNFDPLSFPVVEFPSTTEYEIIVEKALAAAVVQKDQVFYIWRHEAI